MYSRFNLRSQQETIWIILTQSPPFSKDKTRKPLLLQLKIKQKDLFLNNKACSSPSFCLKALREIARRCHVACASCPIFRTASRGACFSGLLVRNNFPIFVLFIWRCDCRGQFVWAFLVAKVIFGEFSAALCPTVWRNGAVVRVKGTVPLTKQSVVLTSSCWEEWPPVPSGTALR